MRTRLALLCTLALLTPAAEAGTARQFRRVVPLDAAGRVSVDSHNGTVTVASWNQPSVSIEARIEASSSGEAIDVEKTEIRVTGSRADLRIETDYRDVPSHSWLFGLGTTRSLPQVHYTIRMPATARLAVSVHNASVKADGLSKGAEIDTHNGSVALTNFSGTAEVDTHNGSVRIAFAKFGAPSRIETHNGSVDVTVPADSRISVTADAHTRSPISSELPLTVRATGSNYSAALNGGGHELRFETHNGELRLARR